MLRRIAATLFVSIAWLACVGDDPGGATTPNATIGERLGPCFDDGTCREGLVCHPTEKICVAVDQTVPDSGEDAAPSENDASTADAEGDANVPQCVLPPAPKIPCPDTSCGTPNTCCVDTATGARSCKPSCAPAEKTFECDTLKACANGTRCCAGVTSTAPGVACEKRLVLDFSYCSTDPCPGSRPACRTGSDCTLPGASTCRLSEVELGPGVTSVWGFCGP